MFCIYYSRFFKHFACKMYTYNNDNMNNNKILKAKYGIRRNKLVEHKFFQ